MSERYHDALMGRLEQIGGLGDNATSLTNAAVSRQMPEVTMPSPDYSKYTGSTSSGGSTGGGKDSFDNFLKAISGQESGGNYGIRNKDSGAMGKYQIMPANISGKGGWDYEALHRDITTSQFMASPELQEQIAQYKLKSYYDKYGAAGAAVAWYAGPGAVKGYNQHSGGSSRNQGNYPSINAYANAILKKMGLA